MKIFALLAILVFSLSANTAKNLCTGIIEENDMRIPVDAKRFGGLTAEQFQSVLDKVYAEYNPDFVAKGVTFQIDRLWESETVNAYAQQNGNTWMISMHGGLARHETVTPDGFTLVACHEIGHHLGGAPKKSSWMGGVMWASNEGQADYFATLKCMRRVFIKEDNEKIVAEMQVDDFAKKECEAEYSDRTEQLICIRNSMAGMSVANLFKFLRKETRQPQFFEPDAIAVAKTNHNHPATQCRLDTYFNGARCPVAVSDKVSDSDYKQGTCDVNGEINTGTRPRCWFSTAGL